MFFNNLNIRHKLILTNIFLILLLIFTLGIVGIRYSFNVIEKDALENLNDMTLEHGYAFNARMTARENLVRSLAIYIRESYEIDVYRENSDYIRGYKNSLAPIVYDMNVLNDNVYVYFNPELDIMAHDIWYFDRDKDGDPERMPEVTMDFYDGDEDKKPWFYGAINERAGIWSNPFSSNIGLDDSYFTFSMPVYVDDEFIGIIGSDFVVRLLQDELKDLKIYKDGYFSIVSDKGQFVVHPEYQYKDTLSTVDDESFKGLSSEISGFRVTGVVENRKNFISYYQLKNDWYLVSTVAKSDVFGEFYGFLARMVLITIVVLLISLAYIIKYSKKLIEPIEILTKNVLEIGEGNYSDSFSDQIVSSSDEIGELVKEVDNMRFKLKNSFETIEQYNRELDDKVMERTRELTNANNELMDTLNELDRTREEIVNSKKMKNLNTMVTGLSKDLNNPIIISKELMGQVSKEVRTTKLVLYNNKLTKSNFLEFMEEIEVLSEDTFEHLYKINEKIEILKRKDMEKYEEENGKE
ncbi:MAG: methyl-accepting chemotaxis protein [Firmicutes bacterium]|nr:methyl-accepting chemotaxis protein [Bacillota bacterium]